MFCSMCGTKAAKTALYCAKCGTKLEAAFSGDTVGNPVESKTEPATTPKAKPSFFETTEAVSSKGINADEVKRKRNIITVAIAVVAVLIFVGIGVANNGSNSTDTSLDDTSLTDDSLLDDTTEDVLPVDWAPSGYTQWDDYLAYKWVTDEHTSDCSDCSYWFIQVVSHYGCPGGVYAEINMLDGDAVVDWSNDTVPSLSDSNSALLEFIHYPYESELQGQLTDLSCNA